MLCRNTKTKKRLIANAISRFSFENRKYYLIKKNNMIYKTNLMFFKGNFIKFMV
jgi:hypothetical protein